MITHCPACHTHFRVHAEQLAARAGQVRCGKCGRVFDALEYLIEEIAPNRPIGPIPEPDASSIDTAKTELAPDPVAEQMHEIGRQVPEQVSAQTPVPREEVPREEPPEPEAPRPEIEAPLVPTPEAAMFEPANPDTAALASASTFNFGSTDTLESGTPKRGWLWPMAALLLLLLLLAQAAYQYRSAIIVILPEAKPYAAALCASLGCDLPLPRRIEQLSIDASDLQADTTNPNVMVLSATLKNRAVFNQQYPLLELTLTDAQDQAVVRRVLAPQDYLGRAVGIQAGFAANSEIAIKVYIEGSQVKATGYRLYLFYP